MSTQPGFQQSNSNDGQSENTCAFGIEDQPPPPAADLGHTGVFRTGDLVPDVEYHGFAQAETRNVSNALSLEANFNRNSIPICERPYGSPIFMQVLKGDIGGVYEILGRCEGSLWDHDPYGLGLLYVREQSPS